MKIIKKILIGLAIFLVVLVAAAMILPAVFKNDIKAAIDKSIAENVNADVVFDVNNFSLSLFKHFPSITAEIKELGVFNRAPFEGEHLFVVNSLEVEINLGDVLFGDQMRIKGITLIKPIINVKVLPDGKANYDIAIPSTDTVKTTEEPTKFSVGIDHWEIIDGEVLYDDKSIPYFLSLKGLDHTGSGDFTQDVFDLRTHTVVDTVNTYMGSMQFLTNKKVEIDAVVSISEDVTKYTFKENSVKVNDFGLGFDGWFKMNPDNFGMDITYKSPENSFKSLLSLVPGMYTKDFQSIETKGDLSFSGFVKGTYSDKQMPAFNLDLKVNNAMFKYPDLPTAVSNINMDLLVDNKDGVINNTLVNLKKLHLDFGTNPVDGHFLIENLRDYKMDGAVNATLNLAELNRMFPMEGLEMKGIYSVNASAKGIYDSLKKLMPAIDASMKLSDGYVKSSQFPLPLQDLKMAATIKNASGKMAETIIAVNDFSMLLDGEKLGASMTLQNLDDYNWDVKATGGVDLEKMTKIFPLKDMTLAGKVKGSIQTRGKMSDVNAKRYDKLPTSGSVALRDFKYTSKDSPPLTISQADLAFDPKKIELSKMNGTIGKSDFAVNGIVSNYLAYVVSNETISGTVTFNSKLLDLNEFMTDSGTTPAATDTASFGVIPIPENIDFIMKSSVSTVKMMDYTMTDAHGDVVLKNGVANLSGLKFNMLGGAFTVNGAYNAKNIKHPKYDFSLKIENMAIQEAAHSFSMVKTYAPFAGAINGDFSTDFKVNGELKQNMMPNMNTVNGSGLINIAKATMTQSKLLSGVSSLASLKSAEQVTLKDVLMSATINNGRLSVKPFDVNLGSYPTTITGSSGVDGSIDYALKMLVPAGQLGSQMQGYLNQYTGSKNSTDKIPLTLNVGGTYNDPKTSLVSSNQSNQVKDAVAKEADQKSKDAVKSLTESLLGGTKTDTTKTKKDSTATQTQDVLQNKLNNLLKKKKN